MMESDAMDAESERLLDAWCANCDLDGLSAVIAAKPADKLRLAIRETLRLHYHQGAYDGLRSATAAASAQAIEAGTAETEGLGAEGAKAWPEGCAQDPAA